MRAREEGLLAPLAGCPPQEEWPALQHGGRSQAGPGCWRSQREARLCPLGTAALQGRQSSCLAALSCQQHSLCKWGRQCCCWRERAEQGSSEAHSQRQTEVAQQRLAGCQAHRCSSAQGTAWQRSRQCLQCQCPCCRQCSWRRWRRPPGWKRCPEGRACSHESQWGRS